MSDKLSKRYFMFLIIISSKQRSFSSGTQTSTFLKSQWREEESFRVVIQVLSEQDGDVSVREVRIGVDRL